MISGVTGMPIPKIETIQEWKAVYEQYKLRLSLNNKPIMQVIEYLKLKYPLKEETSDRFKEIVVANIKMNEQLALKIPAGKELTPIVFTVSNEGNAIRLYETREKFYNGIPIIIGMEVETGYFFVEGSTELADEVTAFKGLDEHDIQNYYIVANYIRCLKKYQLLENVLNY
ncbi:MAG TPA: hypothetical protein VEC37_00785 [Bacillota bacterium]|nr:hypothetical protein [Bacillota bacterium]